MSDSTASKAKATRNAAGSSGDEAKPPMTLRGRLGSFGRMILPAVLAAAVVLPVRSAVADWNDVPTGSMWPTIVEGDRIYVDKLAYGLRVPFTKTWIASWDDPQRGDIVTFASPKDGIRMVKRVIGVPGDRLSMTNNQLSVNGQVLTYDESRPTDRVSPRGHPMLLTLERLPPDRTHPVALTPGTWGIHTFAELVVSEGHFFFLGDNRDQSYDSRFIGLVPRSDVYGRVLAIALSVDPENSYMPRFDRWFTPIH